MIDTTAPGEPTSSAGPVRLTAEQELEAYEGLRRGDRACFRMVAATMEPLLHRLLALATDDRLAARLAIADTWATRLRALGMFQWHTTLTAWIAAGVVRRGRVLADDDPARHLPPRPVAAPAPGPADWADLPFGPRWAHAVPALADAQAGLPLALREVLHVHHVERWPTQEGCDVLGLTGAGYAQLLDDGHAALHAVLARHVGEEPGAAVPGARIAPMGAALRLGHGPPAAPPASPDPLLVATFRMWTSGVDPRLQRAAGHVIVRLPRPPRSRHGVAPDG